MMTNTPHIPVLLDEVLSHHQQASGKIIVDATFGAGGYTRAFLNAGAHVIGLDRDPTAIAAGHKTFDTPHLILHQTPFSRMDTIIKNPVDGVVMDIGVSSMQLDQAERGFSFQQDAPLDMRMDTTSGLNAFDLVNDFPEEVLADIFYYFGEERASRRAAKVIVQHRAQTPIKTTLQLAELIASCLKIPGYQKRHPATQIFQALRIAVNDELGELFHGLCAAERILKPDGVLSVVTFHSLEDRIVKRFFQLRSKGALSSNAGQSRYSQDIPIIPQSLAFKPLTKRPITPSQAEQDNNPRARSAKLRAGQRLGTDMGSSLTVRDFEMPALNLTEDLNKQSWS